MPNRREPITIKMSLCMITNCDGNFPDILDSVLHDRSVLDIFCCFYICEWAHNTSDMKKTLTSPDGLSLALVSPDLTFLCANRHVIPELWLSELHDANVDFVQF